MDYQKDKRNFRTRPLEKERVIREFKYWKIIENRYPYNIAFRTHHMLIPKRAASEYSDLNWRERRELRRIIDNHFQMRYHMVFENMRVRRSVHILWHLHMVVYYDNRTKMSL